MKVLRSALAFVVLLTVPLRALAAETTVTGIPLDAPWKVTIYHLAQTKFIHPAWGWQHSERNYDIAMELAGDDKLTVDTDILFAACMLHDMEAFAPYQRAGEHGAVAAVESEPILRDAGFPMSKFPAVQAAMRGHMYYRDPGKGIEAILLHDADSLDFLGAIGAVRILALTGESKPSARNAVRDLRSFVKVIPPKLITNAAKKIGAQRAAELTAMLDAYDIESFGGKLP